MADAGEEVLTQFGRVCTKLGIEIITAHSPQAKGRAIRFHGGEVIVSYLFNDATRPYNTAGGYFRALVPKRSVFEGGPGAWELVLRYTRCDFNDKTVQGGTFGRFTSQVNWYLSQNVRLELNYGSAV